MKEQEGFSLIELLIVVAIILIIAAIAIPNLIRSKMAANEASAVASLRTLNTAEVTYNNTYPATFGNLTSLGPNATPCVAPAATGACLIDALLKSGLKSGYTFTIGGNLTTTYTTQALPTTAGSTGTRSFCSDTNLVIFFMAAGGACTVTTGVAL